MDGEGVILELDSLIAKEHGEGPKTVLDHPAMRNQLLREAIDGLFDGYAMRLHVVQRPLVHHILQISLNLPSF